jgi:hypothetical protein
VLVVAGIWMAAGDNQSPPSRSPSSGVSVPRGNADLEQDDDAIQCGTLGEVGSTALGLGRLEWQQWVAAAPSDARRR